MKNIPLKSEIIEEVSLYIFVALYLVAGFLLTLLAPEYCVLYYLGTWIGPIISSIGPFSLTRELSFHYWFKGEDPPRRKYDIRICIKLFFVILFVIISTIFAFLFVQIHPDSVGYNVENFWERIFFFASLLVFALIVSFYTHINAFVENKSKIKHGLQLIKSIFFYGLIYLILAPSIIFVSQGTLYVIHSVAALLLALRYFFKGRRYFLTDNIQKLLIEYENTKKQSKL